jgi:hypothetical protein
MNAWAKTCRAPRVQPDREWLLKVYQLEPLNRLSVLERALIAERAGAKDTDTIAFCEWRLPLVRQVIAERRRGPDEE